MIAIENLSVRCGAGSSAQSVLHQIHLTIPKGGTCAIIGPSGCGKSTLLKILAGIITTYEGSVTVNQAPVSPKRQRIGFIPQNYGLLPWKNVRQNVCLGVKIKRSEANGDADALDTVMRQLGIGGLEERYPGEISGGQQQRASLARAFLLKPDVLLMDEPFSALDAITREEMQDVFLDIWEKQAVSTVLVTHYVEEAIYLGQHIVVLSPRPGRIVSVLENPLFGGRDIRAREEFFALSQKLRGLIQKGWAD